MKPIIIAGSSRRDGNTQALVYSLVEKSGWDSIDLNDYRISYYDYEHHNREDDYIELMRRIVEGYDTMLLVTPVYWYSMSGIMKVFFDRITDLLTIEKELGRKLRSMSMAVATCSHGSHLGDSFWLPFSESAEYLGMNYLGNVHTISSEDSNESLAAFIRQIKSSI